MGDILRSDKRSGCRRERVTMKRRLLAIALLLALICSVLPVQTNAAESREERIKNRIVTVYSKALRRMKLQRLWQGGGGEGWEWSGLRHLTASDPKVKKTPQEAASWSLSVLVSQEPPRACSGTHNSPLSWFPVLCGAWVRHQPTGTGTGHLLMLLESQRPEPGSISKICQGPWC